MKFRILLFCFISSVLGGCAAHIVETPILNSVEAKSDSITLGAAQKISIGDSSRNVIAQLGSPTIITKTSKGNESWVYEKYSKNFEMISKRDNSLIFQKTASAQRRSTAETSLIVIIDFDELSKVEDMSYRYTKF